MDETLMPLPHGVNASSIGTGLEATGPFQGSALKAACPRCAEQGKQVPMGRPSGDGSSRCSNNHAYATQEELRAEMDRVRPAPIRQPGIKVIFPGQSKLEVIVKDRVRDRLTEKYGERLESVVASHLAALCEDCLVFAGDDAKLLRDATGEPRGNSFEVAAKVKNMGKELADASSRLAQSRASAAAEVASGPGGRGVFVKLSDHHLKQVQELAQSRDKQVSEVLREGIEFNLDCSNF